MAEIIPFYVPERYWRTVRIKYTPQALRGKLLQFPITAQIAERLSADGDAN